jgi:hypothetical protein
LYSDELGRFIILETVIQDTFILVVNIYAPTRTNEQSDFYKMIENEVQLSAGYNNVIGGDFNVIFDTDLDGLGDRTLKDSVKFLEIRIRISTISRQAPERKGFINI